MRSGELVRLWQDELGPRPPYSFDRNNLTIGYNLTAEFGTFMAKGWGCPAQSLDMYVEYRHLHNDGAIEEARPKGFFSEPGALQFFGEDPIDTAHKKEMRNRIMQGPPFTAQERADILDYCENDVVGLIKLVKHIVPTIRDLPQALYRSLAMWAFGAHQFRGVPFGDGHTFTRVVKHWDIIRCDLVSELDIERIYSIVDGKPKWGKAEDVRFLRYCRRLGIDWPLQDNGRPDHQAQTWKDMCAIWPELNHYRELRASMGKLKLQKLEVGGDWRNRTSLFPFGTKTGRCAPGANSFVFGPAKWLRFFISPPSHLALCHRDFSQQEPVVAALLSGDSNLLRACEMPCGVYLGIASQLGIVPEDATKHTHGEVRDLFKVVVLAIMYGMHWRGLTRRTKLSDYDARELLAQIQSHFRKFFDFCDYVNDFAGLEGYLETRDGWRMQCPPDINPRTARNFPIQSTGAAILRATAVLCERRGIEVIAPVHDALMAQGPLSDIEDVNRELERAMRDGSALVLQGYELKSDEQIIRPGEHYTDDRGKIMWDTVLRLVNRYG
jgi:hypothetical protein